MDVSCIPNLNIVQSIIFFQHEGHNGECWLHYNCDRLVDHEWEKYSEKIWKYFVSSFIFSNPGARTAWSDREQSAAASADRSSPISTIAARDQLSDWEILTKHIAPQQESLPDSPSRLHFCLLQSRKRTNYKETYKVSQKTSFQKFQVFGPLHHLPKQTKTVQASMPFQIFDHKYCIGLSWKIMDQLDHASVQNLKSKNKNLK